MWFRMAYLAIMAMVNPGLFLPIKFLPLDATKTMKERRIETLA
jgi:hypothetical protein